MSSRQARPADPLAPLLAALARRFDPEAIWLFGSRARGGAAPTSDWDLVIALRNDAPDRDLDPVEAWSVAREVGIRATILTARSADISESWGIPNTIGYDLARDGRRLDVGRP